MEESKTEDNDALRSDSTSLLTPKPVTLSTLQKEKESALKARAQIHLIKSTPGQFVVGLTASAVPVGTPRMLTLAEIDELRQTKQSIALHMRELYRA